MEWPRRSRLIWVLLSLELAQAATSRVTRDQPSFSPKSPPRPAERSCRVPDGPHRTPDSRARPERRRPPRSGPYAPPPRGRSAPRPGEGPGGPTPGRGWRGRVAGRIGKLPQLCHVATLFPARGPVFLSVPLRQSLGQGTAAFFLGPPARSSAARKRRNKMKSVISGDMCVGNDTSRARWADFSVRNRGLSCAQPVIDVGEILSPTSMSRSQVVPA